MIALLMFLFGLLLKDKICVVVSPQALKIPVMIDFPVTASDIVFCKIFQRINLKPAFVEFEL